MTIAFYPAHLSPYSSGRLLAVARVGPADYPRHDGVCIKLGALGVSVSWRRSR